MLSCHVTFDCGSRLHSELFLGGGGGGGGGGGVVALKVHTVKRDENVVIIFLKLCFFFPGKWLLKEQW